MDFEAIKKAAQSYEKEMTKFLRDLIAIPGESCGEECVIKRIEKEMNELGFDEVKIDGMGNILGYMGSGETLVAFDAHIDTVGLGEISNWKFDPYKGYENETEIGGRGASDQLGGIVSSATGQIKDPDASTNKWPGTVRRGRDGLCWPVHRQCRQDQPELCNAEPLTGYLPRTGREDE